MKCETAQERIALAVYGELADDQKHQLEQHLSGCDACLQEWEGAQALAKAMSLLPVEEPSANLVARSRMRLEEALDALPRGGWLSQLARQFTQGVNRLRSAPVAASALLVVGLSAGAYGGFWSGEHAHASEQSKFVQPSAGSVASNEDQAAPIANVSSVVQQPGSKNIEVRYDRLLPRSIQGSSDDPAIRQLLLLGAQNRLNPDVRASSVALLADGCRNRHLCDDAPVRNTLMVSLLYDSSLPVRLKALDGLQPYIANDTRVRDAVLQSLLNDPDTQVKTQAIGLLEPVQGDSSVREVLHTVAARDDSPQIRDVSQQVLNQVQQIQ